LPVVRATRVIRSCGLVAVAAGVLLAFVGAAERAQPDASARPNVLLVSIDSLRADHLGG
jgi:hypothetical protein